MQTLLFPLRSLRHHSDAQIASKMASQAFRKEPPLLMLLLLLLLAIRIFRILNHITVTRKPSPTHLFYVVFVPQLGKCKPCCSPRGAIHSNPNRAGTTQIASKMRFRSHPKQPKPSGNYANSVKNALPKPCKATQTERFRTTQTERELRK